ncbi:MAG: hypothetical protein H6Q89_2440 [Myxococcaceae bacterium]|nr:hypothetical protein [Myxococcaceae bacterium]
MSPLRLALLGHLLLAGCAVAPGAVAAPPPDGTQKTREELVRETHALIDSITARLSERDLAASVAAEQVALLHHRAGKLRARCEQLSARDRAQFEPHLRWLEQVHSTTTLSIGVLRDQRRDFDEDKAEVLLWTRVFMKEIDALERRIDRVAPVNLFLSQRTRMRR